MKLLLLAWLLVPAYAANMAPPFVRFWRGWNPPIDAPLLGAHKTLLGFASGVLAAVATAVLQAFLASAGLAPAMRAPWPALGLALGIGAMAGDAAKSLFKRALRKPPGARWIPFDQLDFLLGALLMLAPVHRPGWRELAALVALTFAGDLLVNRIAYRLGIKRTPW